MNTITISKPHLCTKLPIWSPKYNTESGEYEAWLSVSKIGYASPIIIVEFTKAKHLLGQRFCIRKDVAMRCERGTNGKIPVYKVPFSKMDTWQTAREVADIANSLYED